MSSLYFNSLGGFATFVIVVVSIVLALLWLLLPFAVFRMREQVAEMGKDLKRTNDLLERLLERQAAG